MRRNELPDFCLSTLPSSGQLIALMVSSDNWPKVFAVKRKEKG